MTIYETIDSDYLVYSDLDYEKICRAVMAALPTVSGAGIRVLELGCGSGAFSRHFDNSVISRCLGVDVSEALLAVAREQLSSDTHRFEAAEISEQFLTGIDIASYHLVFAGAFWHHIEREERSKMLAHIDSRLRPGSVFAMFEPNALNRAIAFQYKYETKLNKSQYDWSEFPLSPFDIEAHLPSAREREHQFLDVKYRPGSARRPILRLGVAGRITYAICNKAFSLGYRFAKTRTQMPAERRHDYFLSIYRY